MRKPRISAKEQYQLIMQCRQSGLSDHQWCLEHDIHPGTFYNWVRRLRQNPDLIIPEKTEPQNRSVPRQEVVKVELTSAEPPSLCQETYPSPICGTSDAMELSFMALLCGFQMGRIPSCLFICCLHGRSFHVR